MHDGTEGIASNSGCGRRIDFSRTLQNRRVWAEPLVLSRFTRGYPNPVSLTECPQQSGRRGRARTNGAPCPVCSCHLFSVLVTHKREWGDTACAWCLVESCASPCHTTEQCKRFSVADQVGCLLACSMRCVLSAPAVLLPPASRGRRGVFCTPTNTSTSDACPCTLPQESSFGHTIRPRSCTDAPWQAGPPGGTVGSRSWGGGLCVGLLVTLPDSDARAAVLVVVAIVLIQSYPWHLRGVCGHDCGHIPLEFLKGASHDGKHHRHQ